MNYKNGQLLPKINVENYIGISDLDIFALNERKSLLDSKKEAGNKTSSVRKSPDKSAAAQLRKPRERSEKILRLFANKLSLEALFTEF